MDKNERFEFEYFDEDGGVIRKDNRMLLGFHPSLQKACEYYNQDVDARVRAWSRTGIPR